MRQGLALLVMLDGVLTTVFGKSFLRFLRRRLPFPVPQVAMFFLLWPSGLLRRGALRFARAVLIARCVDQAPERLPEPAFQTVSGVRLPLIAVEALHPSAPARIDAALTSLGQDRPLAY